MHSGGRVVGVLEFISGEELERDEALVRVVAGVADQFGQFLERRRAQDALRESEERSWAILESAQGRRAHNRSRGPYPRVQPRRRAALRFLTRAAGPRADRMSESDRATGAAGRARAGVRAPSCGRARAGSWAGGSRLPALRADGTTFPAELSVMRIRGFGRPELHRIRSGSERASRDRPDEARVRVDGEPRAAHPAHLAAQLTRDCSRLGTAGELSKKAGQTRGDR